jgi:hypothetical protein
LGLFKKVAWKIADEYCEAAPPQSPCDAAETSPLRRCSSASMRSPDHFFRRDALRCGCAGAAADMIRVAVLSLAVAASAHAWAAGPRLTEPTVRAFVARQEAAWNARDLAAFEATFTPDAVFVDQARNSNGGVTSNGSSTLTEAVAQAKRFFGKARFRETSVVDAVAISVDGRSALVTGHEVSQMEATAARPARRLCAETRQTVVLVRGRILSKGQTDTDVRCPR